MGGHQHWQVLEIYTNKVAPPVPLEPEPSTLNLPPAWDVSRYERLTWTASVDDLQSGG